MVMRKVYKWYLEYYLLSPLQCNNDNNPTPTSLVSPRTIQEIMDDSEEDEGTAQLIASEASAGTKGGGGDCDDLAIIRNSTMSLTTLVLCFFYLSNMLLGS
jgi:hypothetical protein